MLHSFGLFLFLSGFILGLGAVTVIDVLGFLGRKSSYWTEVTIKAHKVTKPLIWLGIILALSGGLLFYSSERLTLIPILHAVIACVLIINGCFLSVKISPYLHEQERKGRATELLSGAIQKQIFVSFIVSDTGWWLGLCLLVVYLT